MIKLLRKITLIFLTFQREKKKKKVNQLFQWVRSLHLDNEVGNPTTHACKFGVDVERMLSKEVHSESFSKKLRIHFRRH